MTKFKNTAPPMFWFYTAFCIGKILNANKKLAIKVRNLGDIADYLLWIQQIFSDSFDKKTFVPTRELLWKKISKHLKNSEVTVFEFGVAYGYATNWWLSTFPNQQFNWNGFDRFTGLPRPWRDLPAGYFGANGLAPEIKDTRVTWHIGNVEETLQKVDLKSTLMHQALILFDFDIYEPSSFAWNSIKNYLKVGDILYFDEGFDKDERMLINQEVLKFCEVKLIGSTPLALAVAISDFK